ncbi:phosphoanhydride phosphohydrolase [Acetobacter aceti 1023]|nr:phosphoanhydride phosphohydrolase [Acetobacter aceti 1023]
MTFSFFRSAFFLSANLLSASFTLSAPVWAATSAPAVQPETSDAVLERVVLVSRHGIRSPTKPLDKLEKKTRHTWTPWPVPPGEMTAHGQFDLGLMGQFLKSYYHVASRDAAARCLPEQPAFIWADSASSRTQHSGDILAAALSDGCQTQARSMPAKTHDPLFNALAAKKTTLDADSIEKELDPAPMPDTDLPPPVQSGVQTLQALFAPNACTTGTTPCFFKHAPLAWKKGTSHAENGLALGSTVSEALLLEYVQGLPSSITVANTDSVHTLNSVLPVHNYQSARMRRTPAIAIPRGGKLAQAILALLNEQPLSLPDGSMLPAQARVVMFAGHDTTLDMLTTLFGLDWSFTDQPDPTAPDTTLAFETWKHPDGRKEIRFAVFHQSLAQLREGLKLDNIPGQGAPMPLTSTLCTQPQNTACWLENLSKNVPQH